MVSKLARNARDASSILTLSAIFPIFIIPHDTVLTFQVPSAECSPGVVVASLTCEPINLEALSSYVVVQLWGIAVRLPDKWWWLRDMRLWLVLVVARLQRPAGSG